MMLVAVKPVRAFDHTEAGIGFQEGLEAQYIAVVEDALPPVLWHECRQNHDYLLPRHLSCRARYGLDVRQERCGERTVGRLDHLQWNIRRCSLPPLSEGGRLLGVVRNVYCCDVV